MTASGKKAGRGSGRLSAASFTSPTSDNSQLPNQSNQSQTRITRRKSSAGGNETTEPVNAPSSSSSSSSHAASKPSDVYKTTTPNAKTAYSELSPSSSSIKHKYASKFIDPILSKLIIQAENKARNSEAARLWLHKLKSSIQKKVSLLSKHAFLTPENDAMEIDHDIKALEEQIYNQTKNLHDLTTQQMNTHKLLASQQFIPSQEVTGRFETTVTSIGQKVHQISEELSSTNNEYQEKCASFQNTLQVVNTNLDQLLEKQQHLMPAATTANSVPVDSKSQETSSTNVPKEITIPVSHTNHSDTLASNTLTSSNNNDAMEYWPVAEPSPPLTTTSNNNVSLAPLAVATGMLQTIAHSSTGFEETKTSSPKVITPLKSANISGILTPHRPAPQTPATPLTAVQAPLQPLPTPSSANRRGDNILQSASKLQMANNQRKQATTTTATNNNNNNNNAVKRPAVASKDPLQRLHDHLLPK